MLTPEVPLIAKTFVSRIKPIVSGRWRIMDRYHVDEAISHNRTPQESMLYLRLFNLRNINR